MSIKISCIIPYFNVERDRLFQCINSILQQDFQDYEIILVDDGSEETYRAYLEEVSRLDSRIKLIRQQNQGVSAARNNGIRHANGFYVTFVDADDWIVPFFFSEAYHIAEENHAAYVVGGVLYTQSQKQKLTFCQPANIEVRDTIQYRPSLIVVKDKMAEGGYFGRGPVAKFVKRDILEHIFFPENVKLGEDIIWNLDVTANCDKVYMVYQVWYLYWRNPESASLKYNASMITICEQHLQELIQRMNLQDEKEITALFLHIYELLRANVYGCYLGRKECPLPVFKRAKVFRETCKKEPWTSYQTELFLKNCTGKERIQHFLVKSGMLYWYLAAKNLFAKRKQ